MGVNQSVVESDHGDFQSDKRIFLDEILRIVFSFLSGESNLGIVQYSNVCWQWRRIIQHEIGLSVHISTPDEVAKSLHTLKYWKVKSIVVIEFEPAKILQNKSNVQNLERLDIWTRKKEIGKCIQIIVKLKNLQHLRLSGQFEFEHFQMIGQSENMRNLKSIYLNSYSKNMFNDEVVYALCCSGNLLKMEDVEFGIGFLITINGLNVIVNSFKLKRFSLKSSKVTDEGLIAIANSPNMINLKTLNLPFNNLTSIGAIALARSEHIKELTSLDISYNNIGNEGFIELFQSGNLSKIERLIVNNCGIQMEGLVSFAKSPHHNNLTFLDLSNYDFGKNETLNKLSTEAFTCLVSSNKMLNLEELRLRQIGIEDFDQALTHLLKQSDNFPKLQSLHLINNNIGTQSVDKLINFSNFNSLMDCHIIDSENVMSKEELENLNTEIRKINKKLQIL